MRAAAVLLCVGLAAVACAGETVTSSEPPRHAPQVEKSAIAPGPAPTETATAEETRALSPDAFDAGIASSAVRHLADGIGPRHATSHAYDTAAQWVASRFEDLGLTVRRQRIDVPGGTSWGVPVGPGRSVNVVATTSSYRSGSPHLLVGAHLDTVPQAPGAEDNASGVGVLLAVATAVTEHTTRLPVVLVAFGAEEPRGDTDADHHYGSRTYVAALSPRERRAVRGMVSLDRVGVGEVVPIGSAREGADPLAAELARAARAARVPTLRDLDRSSDHWQFVQVGLPGVRLGSTPYAGYHSAEDVPGVVERSQLRRTGRIVLQWLAP